MSHLYSERRSSWTLPQFQMLYRLVLTGMLLLHTLSKVKNVHVLQVKFDIKFALDSLRDKPANPAKTAVGCQPSSNYLCSVWM